MRRRSVGAAAASVAALLMASWLGVAGAFVAELTVVAYGTQRFDLATGFTELPDGGEVVERGTSVRLVAPWIRYAEGRSLEATDATVEGPFGRLEAPLVQIDLAQGSLAAEGGIELHARHGSVVRAERIDYEADGWVVARGDVSGEAPSFTAQAVWADAESGRLVLVSPYAYEDGPVRLRSDAPGSALQLTPLVLEDGSVAGYDASTSLDHDVDLRLRTRSE